MNSDFITIIRNLIKEQGKEVLFNPSKCKAFLTDYTHGEYKKERRLLLQAVEAGVPRAIDTSDNLSQCKQKQIKILREDFFIVEEIAADIVETLEIILRESDKQTKFPSKSYEEKKFLSPNTETDNQQKQKNMESDNDVLIGDNGIKIIGWIVTIIMILLVISVILLSKK